jgi:hypothetical protein
MLAELKLHIRDEYKQNDAAKARLKRHIAGTVLLVLLQATQAFQPRTKRLVSMAARRASAGPPVLSTLSQPQPQFEMPQDADDTLVSPAGPAAGSLDDIAQSLLNLVNAEDDTTESHPSPTGTASPIPIKLSDLFDFTVGSYWSQTVESTGTRGLQDELEFYELLDTMDASGELDVDVDVDVGVDGMSEAVLMSNYWP